MQHATTSVNATGMYLLRQGKLKAATEFTFLRLQNGNKTEQQDGKRALPEYQRDENGWLFEEKVKK